MYDFSVCLVHGGLRGKHHWHWEQRILQSCRIQNVRLEPLPLVTFFVEEKGAVFRSGFGFLHEENPIDVSDGRVVVEIHIDFVVFDRGKMDSVRVGLNSLLENVENAFGVCFEWHVVLLNVVEVVGHDFVVA